MNKWMRRWTCRSVLGVLAVFGFSTVNAAGNPVAGKSAFTKCASCHHVGPTARGAFGPQLNGIVGRKAAGTSDFKYSPAMQQAGFVWTEARLRAFLKSPDTVVPDNKMRFSGIRSEGEIDDLLAYMRSL